MFPTIPQLAEYEELRRCYEDLQGMYADANRDVTRLTKLVSSLENEDVSKLADALRRGEHDVSQDDIVRARDDLAAAERRRDALKLAVNRQRAAVVAACRDHGTEWDATLAPLHDAAVVRYREALNELFEAQTEIEQLMDARQMLDTPHEDRRKHGRFAGRSGVAVGGQWTRWAELHNDLLTYGGARQVEPVEETSGAGWMPR